jgi:hypothetical protein
MAAFEDGLISPYEMQQKLKKMPPCQHDGFGKCGGNKDAEFEGDYCTACLIYGVYQSLANKNDVLAMHFLDGLQKHLELDLKIYTRKVKPKA